MYKKKIQKYFVYLYYNKSGNVIYVGLTARPLANRVREHRTEAMQHETDHIEFAEVPTKADMRLYELYYINRFHPKYNTADMYMMQSIATLPDLQFVPYVDAMEKREITDWDRRQYVCLCNGGKIQMNVLNPYDKSIGPVRLEVMGTPELTLTEIDQLIEQLSEIKADLT